MKVSVIQCGPTANESEQKAIEHLRHKLLTTPGNDEWVLLTNLAFSVSDRMQSDEIDIVAVGPPGVRLIEVKHWAGDWITSRTADVEAHADLITGKARKVGTTLRKVLSSLPRVDGAFLLTQEPSKLKRVTGQIYRGVAMNTLNAWKDALGFEGVPVLSRQLVHALSHALEPRSKVLLDGGMRRFAGYVNLELQTPREERFHRVYKGSHPSRRDRVIVHLYDLSAVDEKNAIDKAEREFKALHQLQRYAWAPRILDSFQYVPGFPGEMHFFTFVDPAAPSIEERVADDTWEPLARIEFARSALRALHELHQEQASGGGMVHRNLTPHNILVRHDNTPILVGFDRTRIPSDVSVASGGLSPAANRQFIAPEVASGGLSSADQRSDLYAMCACLSTLFAASATSSLSEHAGAIIHRGMEDNPQDRATIANLVELLGTLVGESRQVPLPPPARYWTEGQIIPFKERLNRIINRLGSGGVGTTYKVIEIDRSTQEQLGTYVAKVARDKTVGQATLRAYSLARSHLVRHAGLSSILEVAREWEDNGLVALMSWVEGTPLDEFTTILPLVAEDLREEADHLISRWVCDACRSLGVLHRNGLIHGDVSPRNLIVSESELVLTDYDFVTKIGEAAHGWGTKMYCSPAMQDQLATQPQDDIYALAASIFKVVFDRDPFAVAGQLEKSRGLNWDGLDREQYPSLTRFFDRATNADASKRYASVEEAISSIQSSPPADPSNKQRDVAPTLELPSSKPGTVELVVLKEQRIEWLRDVLRSYPGSPGGNQETRGLDSSFATDTYVETLLEQSLVQDIRQRRARLVVLCGNAGDGKTALLQHLSQKLGLGRHASANRILKGTATDGLTVRMNLDGSAAWNGRSADQLLDEFLEPFIRGAPAEDVTHLLAVNDGRLLEWIEGFEARTSHSQTVLTSDLLEHLQRTPATPSNYLRFITLNERSLVGDAAPGADKITTDFLNRLIDQLYGGTAVGSVWKPCLTCSAQTRCEIFRAARLFAPERFPAPASNIARSRARERLFEALQAVHLRGETHITVRELRSALVYILFGIKFCDSYHGVDDAAAAPYWDRAFAPDSPLRQGEVLLELLRFDPALETHAQIDRHLAAIPISDIPPTAPRYPDLPNVAARRRAFFEWTEQDLLHVAGDPHALDLARGRHIRSFRDLPLVDEQSRAELCRRICQGIARLEDLPPSALDRKGVVPLRVVPRTPTESAFWVEKPIEAFQLEPDLPTKTEGIERLHRQARLVYRYRDGRSETLLLGAELFHLLLELADGYQLGDVSTDDTFANLSIFVQRLVQEDAGELLAWSPMADETIYRVAADICREAGKTMQHLKFTSAGQGVSRG